jgi:transcriptional regulator with XRE-family HTH domain
MTLRENFAANLRRLRLSAQLSQEELAHRADLDRTYVSALERCQYSASLDTIAQLAGALDVEPHMLLLIPSEINETSGQQVDANRPIA